MQRTTLILITIIPACALLLSCGAPARDTADRWQYLSPSTITCNSTGSSVIITPAPGQRPEDICPPENIRAMTYQIEGVEHAPIPPETANAAPSP